MTLEVGMYVRTERGKIWLVTSTKAIDGHKHRIVNADYNILKLIQVGDYVNGMEVVAIDSDGRLYVPVDLGKPYDREFSNECFYHTLLDMEQFKIKSIVTKEQFESMSYKVGE